MSVYMYMQVEVEVLTLDFCHGIAVLPWDDKPYEVLRGGRKVYLDEQDVVAFLNPPKDLVPLDPASFNPAAYLWLISRAWALSGTRYEDPKLLKKSASSLLSSNGDGESAIGEFAKSRWPLYFAVKHVNEVMSTAQPRDLAYEFGDGLLDIHEYPSGFPRAGEEILATSNPTWYEY
ncbi:pentatricopeptide repeat (PPR) superfamily protein [Actinidia rufa]|uniref:Pentatricopeptide repeat (PPR) superfamily protein n=1 Tax=Actinidia rufa TaxID=165716 RepID=A0A7J0FF39_9ERIC|nr:pentatricopeptide repeat (PPR) superfamily protein [Actinidia rufa]